MKIPYSIIRSWTKFKGTPDELRSLIDLHITEVESMVENGKFSHMVVGEILEILPHPNADKLQITKTRIGDETLQIVCGGKNIKVGQKVPVALPGSVVANGMEISVSNIRGEDSFGMLCSGNELGFADAVDGVMILDADLEPGTPLAQVFDENGSVALDLKVLADRPDYMSFLSIAREVSASLGEDFTYKLPVEYSETRKFTTENSLSIKKSVSADQCSRYLAKVVKGIVVTKSPEWIQNILHSVGMKPINNIVDCANLTMLETGQPIHVFDLSKIHRASATVRMAKSGEKMIGLDDVEYSLTSEDIVIAGSKGVLAIAGIIGGKNSGVTDVTTEIAIEIANFNRKTIRRSARRLGIRTDASSRFERGVDVNGTNFALSRLLNLIQETSPSAQIAKGVIDIHQDLPPVKREISFDLEKVKKLCDLPLTNTQIQKILDRLHLFSELSGKNIRITVPSFRSDIATAEDVAEELIRIHGLDKIESRFPQVKLSPVTIPSLMRLRSLVNDILVRLGGVEVKTHPFYSSTVKGDIALENPLNENWTHLKSDLLGSLLALEYESESSIIFEVNKVFTTKSNEPTESTQLAVRVSGVEAYHRARSILLTLTAELGIADDYRELSSGDGLSLVVGGNEVGRIIFYNSTVSGFAVDLEAISELVVWAKQSAELPKYPSIKIDLAFEVDLAIRIGQMQDAILAVDDLVVGAELFDVFALPDNKRSVAFHITLRSADRTLTKEDRDSVQTAVVEKLAKQFQAKLRG